MFMPAPGCTTCATIMPITSASVEKNRKYAIALANTRPTVRRWVMPAMPVTMVRKITGAMIIFTSLMKASPRGFIDSASAGSKCPSVAPSTMATITWKYSCLYSGCFGGVANGVSARCMGELRDGWRRPRNRGRHVVPLPRRRTDNLLVLARSRACPQPAPRP